MKIIINNRFIFHHNLNNSSSFKLPYYMENAKNNITIELIYDDKELINMPHSFKGLIDIEQFGKLPSFRYTMYHDITASDVPSNLSYMFSEYNGNIPDISHFNMSKVTNISYMFSKTTILNTDFSEYLKSWDLTKVEENRFGTTGLFKEATINNLNLESWSHFKFQSYNSLFDGFVGTLTGLSNWDASLAKSSYAMFSRTTFNENISTWDIKSLNDMSSMFSYNKTFNQDISGWSKYTQIMSKPPYFDSNTNPDWTDNMKPRWKQ